MDEILTDIKEWDLYHSYGKFNISYETLIDRTRSCVVTLIHKYYQTETENRLHRKYTEQFSLKHDEVPENLVDRPLKIVISELSSFSIIQCLKGLVFELRGQNILSFSEKEEKIFTTLFNKIDEANQLRNKIIHSTSQVWTFPIITPMRKGNSSKKAKQVKESSVSLYSRYEKVAKTGYNYQTAIFKISDLENYNVELIKLDGFLFALTRYISTGKLEIGKFDGLSEIDLKTKHKTHTD